MLSFVASSPRPLLSAIAFGGIALVGMLDFYTGFDVSLSVFYAIFVILATWALGRGAGSAASLLAVTIWTLADHYSGHKFSSDWILIWNAAVRFSFLMIVVTGAYHSKRQLGATTARAEALEQVLPVCTCCKRIADEHGAWVEMETYLSEHLSTRPTLKICPDCSRKAYVGKVSPDSLAPANS